MYPRLLRKLYLNLLPSVFKKRTFKPISGFSWKDVGNKNLETELLLVKELLNPNSVFFDIGANIGQYLYMAEMATSVDNIYGFEPNKDLSRRLKVLFPKLHIENIALSNSNGNASFKIPLKKKIEIHTRGTLNTSFIDDNEDDSKVISVKTKTLDSFFEEKKINRIDLIKVDVEGYERYIIEGAKRTLNTYSPKIIVEIEQRHHQAPLDDIIKEIEALNYKCYYLDVETKEIVSFENFSLEKHQNMDNHAINRNYVNNFLFFPRISSKKETEALNARIKSLLANEEPALP